MTYPDWSPRELRELRRTRRAMKGKHPDSMRRLARMSDAELDQMETSLLLLQQQTPEREYRLRLNEAIGYWRANPPKIIRRRYAPSVPEPLPLQEPAWQLGYPPPSTDNAPTPTPEAPKPTQPRPEPKPSNVIPLFAAKAFGIRSEAHWVDPTGDWNNG